MTYRAPVKDILNTMRHAARFDRALDDGLHDGMSLEFAREILDQAGRFAADVIAPLNQPGDRIGTTFKDGVVTTPPGWKETYRAWIDSGWNALAISDEHGGQGLPILLNAACSEMWASAALAFSLGPFLTMGGIEALAAHGADELKQRYLEKAVSGEWPVTMNLTEPASGSDLGGLRTRAERAGDGSYRITGQKIFITYGDHDLTDNILHLVLARLPDAPAGTRGISMFLVPKVLPDRSANDVRCAGIEHKLGIHGSPTCTMAFGDGDGAVGWLVGEENRGLNYMFTMMNNARLVVALEGVAVAERAYQQALAYAKERRQGKAHGAKVDGMSLIVEHPDVQRNLLTMKGLTNSARAICYLAAEALDRSHRSSDLTTSKDAGDRAALLTPIAKSFSTDIGVEVASIGIQIHGGMGFIEETGAAQYLRDARILPIYEGTNGIQAIDLVTRKLPLSGGDTVRALIADLRATAVRVKAEPTLPSGNAARQLDDAIDSLERATQFLLSAVLSGDTGNALAGATPYLNLFGHTLGAALLADVALGLAAEGEGHPDLASRVALWQFYAENILPCAGGLATIVTSGGAALREAGAALAD